MGKQAIEQAERWYGERGDVDAAHIRKEAQWYPDGPQWYRDEDGDWHFPGPDVSALPGQHCSHLQTLRSEDEVSKPELKRPIRIVPLEQGLVIDGGLAFTDAFDIAEWLLDWLGFDPDWVMISRELLENLWGDDEWVDDDAEQLRAEYNEWVEDTIEVARAAQAYIEGDEFGSAPYKKLVEAVKKWQGKERNA